MNLTTLIENKSKKFDKISKNGDWCGCFDGDIGYMFPQQQEKVKNFLSQSIQSGYELAIKEFLTKTEIEQLISYCEDRDRDGWYFGNKAQFEKRHKHIKLQLQSLLKGKL